MLPFVIGAVTGLVTVIGIRVFLKKNEPLIYALVLSGIGFLYVGYTWMDSLQLIFTGIQAVLFLLIAAHGTRNISLLAAGYFLHGIWDLVYNYFTAADTIPPHYDVFCLTVDFIMGAYLIVYKKRMSEAI